MKVHGEDVQQESCEGALAKMPHGDGPQTYVPRHPISPPAPPNSVKTPIRYLSDDGLCAIDVILAPVSAAGALYSHDML